MFISLRDLWFAKGRFALMASVVSMVTVLVVMLSGLTAGLAADNVSAIDQLPATHLSFKLPSGAGDPSFAASSVDSDTWQQLPSQPDVENAAPLGISQIRVDSDAGGLPVALFGVQPQSFIAPQTTAGANLAANQDGLIIGQDLADSTGLLIGDQIQFAGDAVSVVGISPTVAYSHTPVVWAPLDLWQRWTSGGTDTATVVALNLAAGADTTSIDRTSSTTTIERVAAFNAIGAFTEENGSLVMIRGFLFAISALVVGAFFTVWTIQRRHEIGVLKALGASNGYLLRDALGQALLILVVAGGVGLGVGAGLGALAATSVPFVLDLATTVIPVAVMVVVGGLGAGLAVRRVTSVDPLIALGAS